ncbi:MAG: Fur family transcriptional regulator, ferric uptake regulator [Actinomycetota bacterium]|jgi:Fur family ferric uptake transcriptional regulator|nr:Fur family transcriptional regulator, ferric uptake regulator [Actinomycetota bacterium]MDQ1541931.1 Fur family transcriptional regulator, ferric uptake regulator [Actinomycetota bacterium]
MPARVAAEHGRDQARAVDEVDLAPRGERSTKQKRALAGLLGDLEAFRTAQDLHQLLRARGERVGLTTVYNQLKALADAGEVDVLRSESGEALYRQCRTEAHHHHLLCRVCGRTVEVDGPSIEAWTAEVGRREGYTDIAHTVEIVGTCAACQPRRRRAG